MARDKIVKDGNDKKAAEAKLELDIINRIVLFYTSKDTTREQRLKVWEEAEKIMMESPDPKPDDTDGA